MIICLAAIFIDSVMVLVGNSVKKKIIFCIGNVLSPEELNWVTSQVLNGEFVDGKITAGVGASGGEG